MKNDRKTMIFPWLDGLPFNRFHAFMLVTSCLVLAAAGYNLQILAYAVPVILKEWALTPLQCGTLMSCGFLGLMMGALGFGVLGDRIGRRKALMAAIALFSLLSGCASLAPDYRFLAVLRFLTGLGIGGAFPLTVALLSEFSPSSVRARLVTAAVSGFTFGWVVAASLSMILIPKYGWRPVFQFGLLPLLLIPVLRIYLPESIRFLVGKGFSGEALEQAGKIEKFANLPALPWSQDNLVLPEEPQGGPVPLFRGGPVVMAILVCATYLLNTMALYGLSSWLPSLLVERGFSLAKSYSFAMVQAGGSAMGGVLLGCLMDRVGRKHGLILAYLLGGLSLIFFGSVTSNLCLYVAGAATGVLVVGTPTALNVVCSEIYPTGMRATGIASTQAAGRIGSMLGPALGGLFQTLGLSFQQFFLFFPYPVSSASSWSPFTRLT